MYKLPRKKSKNMYGYVKNAWKEQRHTYVRDIQWARMIEWRNGSSITRVKRPTRIDRARELGYKAKQGYVVVRVRVRRGNLQRRKIKGGRRPKRNGMLRIPMRKSIQRMAEERAFKKYPNLEVLNSYYIGEDGKHHFYEIIMIDPHHPAIKNDPKINWIANSKHSGRAARGLTSAGKKGRGMRHKGMGSEKSRPSKRINS